MKLRSELDYITNNTPSHLKYERFEKKSTPDVIEFSLQITNTGLETVTLSDVSLFQAASLEELGFSAGEVHCFRSGRHKNDMPGSFTFGVEDDHLTILLPDSFTYQQKKEVSLTLPPYETFSIQLSLEDTP